MSLMTQSKRGFDVFPRSPGRLRPGRHRLDPTHHQRVQLLQECLILGFGAWKVLVRVWTRGSMGERAGGNKEL